MEVICNSILVGFLIIFQSKNVKEAENINVQEEKEFLQWYLSLLR